MSGKRLRAHLGSFAGIWPGGYLEGDPLAPLSRSTYGQLGYMSVLHATYLHCIRPHVEPETNALEIGPGRGAWTRALLDAREVWALDALSATETGFWEHLGCQPHVTYVQVRDFSCAGLPNDHFDYMFSFGCLCHTPFEGIEAYASNLFPKLRRGAECFWLVADYEKFNRVVADLEHFSILNALVPAGRRRAPLRQLAAAVGRASRPRQMPPDPEDAIRPGRWFHAGTARTAAMLRTFGYDVIDEDVGTSLRDPIVHFRKP